MTRVNLVPPSELVDKHLIAEYRELPRIFSLIRSYSKDLNRHRKVDPLPDSFRLGKGHVRFFYDKGLFLINRQKALVDEMKRRGFRAQFNSFGRLTRRIPKHLMGDYIPTPQDIQTSRDRIEARKLIMGSAMEVKRILTPEAYKKVKPHFARKDWEIVATTEKSLVLRVERENIAFDRKTGRITDRVKLEKGKGR